MPAASSGQLDSDKLTAVLRRAGGELARRYEVLWQAVWGQAHVPAPVLELCRLRLAHLHGAGNEFAASPPSGARDGLEPDQIASLLTGNWAGDARFSPAARAALELAEVYAQDPQAITDELADAVKAQLGEAGLVALIEALGVIDGRIRLGMMLGPLLATEVHRG